MKRTATLKQMVPIKKVADRKVNSGGKSAKGAPMKVCPQCESAIHDHCCHASLRYPCAFASTAFYESVTCTRSLVSLTSVGLFAVRLHVRKMCCTCGYVFAKGKAVKKSSSDCSESSNDAGDSRAKQAAKHAGLSIQTAAKDSAGALGQEAAEKLVNETALAPVDGTASEGEMGSARGPLSAGAPTISSTAKKHKAVSGLLGMAIGQMGTTSDDD